MRAAAARSPAAAIGAQHHVVVLLRGLASADRAAQIGDALAEHELLGLLLVGRPQRGERLLVVADGVVIGVGRAGAIAGRTQEARAFRLLVAQAEMMAEQRSDPRAARARRRTRASSARADRGRASRCAAAAGGSDR